jgi:N-acetylneuraminate lyase
MKLRGLVPAVHTPLHADGSLNLDQIEPLAEFVLADAPAALYVLGSTGEGPSLSGDERRTVAEEWVRVVNGRAPIVVQVGHSSVVEAASLASHAASIGADGISAAPPSYFPYSRPDELIGAYAGIAAGAPELPFYPYHIPRLTGVPIDPEHLLKAADSEIPNLAGIKFSSFEIWQLQACIERYKGRFNMLFGSDEMLLSGMVVGADGAIGSTYGYSLPLYRKVIEGLEAGDMDKARLWQWRAAQMIEVIVRFPAMASLKATMMVLGGPDIGPVRLPLQQMTTEMTMDLERGLREVGVIDWLAEARA